MNHCRHHQPGNRPGRIVLGLCFVIAGVLALLSNLHLIVIGDLSHYWPLIFSVFGLMHLVRRRHLSGMLWGLGLIILGIALSLQNLGLVQNVMSVLIPSFLIMAGISVIARGFMPRPYADKCHQMPPSSLEHDDVINISATMSGTSVRCDSQDFKGGKLNTVMGGLELDLRQASISSQAVLRANIVGGGVSIKIPQDWLVLVRISSVLGGVENKSVPPMQADKTLVLEGDVIMGVIEIKN